MPAFQLYIGYRTTSTWSLRAWMAMRKTGAAFEETMIRYRRPDDKARISEKYLGSDHPDNAYGLRRAEREYDEANSRYSRALIDRTLRLLPDKPDKDNTTEKEDRRPPKPSLSEPPS